jgi:hypothetical protein
MKFLSYFKFIVLMTPLFIEGCSTVTFPCFCGCCGTKQISVLNEPINKNRLASVHVNAPDPRHELNPHGQRLYVSWCLSKRYKDTKLRGVLKVRFNTPEEATIPFEINNLRGTITYQIINEEYFAKEGILAYKVQIFSDGKEVDSYQHSMWTDLISFDSPQHF